MPSIKPSTAERRAPGNLSLGRPSRISQHPAHRPPYTHPTHPKCKQQIPLALCSLLRKGTQTPTSLNPRCPPASQPAGQGPGTSHISSPHSFTLQTGKPRPREGSRAAQGHRASWGQTPVLRKKGPRTPKGCPPCARWWQRYLSSLSSGKAIFSGDTNHKTEPALRPGNPPWGMGPLGNNAKGEKSHLTKTFTGTVCEIENLDATQMPDNSSKQTAVVLMRCGY